MPEGANVEIAHSLSEHDEGGGEHRDGWRLVLEIVEVGLLAIVAIVTAWSGFQAGQVGRTSIRPLWPFQSRPFRSRCRNDHW